MIAIMFYFLCQIRLLKREEQNCGCVTPPEHEAAQTTEKETLKYRTCSMPLETEATEVSGDARCPGMLIYAFSRGD